MQQKEILEKTRNYVEEALSGEGSGHDWWHIVRVTNLALTLAKEEGADLFVVELAALLHDIADWKFHDGDMTAGSRIARSFLEIEGVSEEVISHVCNILEGVSFKGAGVQNTLKTIEGMVVQDADRLDGIGAIGIARTFAYGGHKGHELYNPEVQPEQHDTFEAYKKKNSPTINHFYEKLLLLKDRMNTRSAKKLAEKRHAYMEEFLAQFYKEWEGKA